MPATAWRLWIHAGISHLAHVGGWPCAENLRRLKRDHEGNRGKVSMTTLINVRAQDRSIVSQHDQLPDQWNNTRAEFPQVCAHELFEMQVVRDSRAVALEFGERRVTYRELNERANKVAHYLRRIGVGPDVLVGICLDRSPEMVVALLAVWKAGG